MGVLPIINPIKKVSWQKCITEIIRYSQVGFIPGIKVSKKLMNQSV